MNPFWKKAKWDVVSKEDLERWREVETAIANPPLSYFDRWVASLPPMPEPRELDPEALARFFDDDESWGDPQEDLDSWEEEDFVDERPQEMKDKEAANLALFEEMAKEDPELRRIADNLLNALGNSLADLGDDEEFQDFIEMDMMCDRIWSSSMNQALDESVDFSGEPELFFNLNDFLKKK
jgi:hypothetical protein